MIRQKTTTISIVDEKQIVFLSLAKNGLLARRESLPLEAMLADDFTFDAVPKWVRHTTLSLLVIPDYWLANTAFEFKSRKRSVITAFIERKLKIDHPTLTDAPFFYNYTIAHDRSRHQTLYCTYLQEPTAYKFYRRLEKIGVPPHRISSPALIWQSRLARHIDGFSESGVGFAHLMGNDCFLYFYSMDQFLFSRQIQLPQGDEDPAERYTLLNYEINQSFYLYSQKSKHAVDTLYMLAEDPEACDRLSESLGREVRGVPFVSSARIPLDNAQDLSACGGFSTLDLKNHHHPSIFYRPLYQELVWRPIQWTGIAVGLILILLLGTEAGYLVFVEKDVQDRQAETATASSFQYPQQVLSELTQELNEVTDKLSRPSAGGAMVSAFLSIPQTVSLEKISLERSSMPPRLAIDAMVAADNPDAFKTVLSEFVDQLNRRFKLETRPLREKDIGIKPVEDSKNGQQLFYRISFNVELS